MVLVVDGDEEEDGDDSVEKKRVEEMSVERMPAVRGKVCRVEIVEDEVKRSDDESHAE